MWRIVVAVMLACACGSGNGGNGGDSGGGDAPSNAMRTPPFTPMLCTSGTPGDPTCPITYVALSFSTALNLTFVARPVGQILDLQMIVLSGAAVHVDGMYVERWASNGTSPLSSVLMTASVDVGSGASLPNVRLPVYMATESLRIRVDAIR